MKKMTICMALLASTSAFAGPLQDGTILLIAGKAQVLQNSISASLTKSAIVATANDLRELDVKNSKLKAIYATCADKLEAQGIKGVSESEPIYGKYLSEELTKSYNQLKANVAARDSAVNCSGCDAEIRNATIEKYSSNININLRDLKSLSERTFPADFTKEVSERMLCELESFYKFNDSKKFDELKDWSFGSYSSKISPAQILSGDYTETLDLIVRKAPIKINRTASKFGTASSEYKNGEINIKLTYDSSIITGPDNVRHPELQNPINIINRDR